MFESTATRRKCTQRAAGLLILSCVTAFASAAPGSAAAQDREQTPEKASDPAPASVPPIRINLSDDGQRFVHMITWHQFWVRATELNPGTQLPDSDADVIGDVAIRRSRFLLFGKITPEVLVLLHFGINNQTFDNDRKPQLYVHDAWGQIDVLDNYLSLGAGLHYWNGVSRMTSASTFKFLAIDAPVVNWPTIEATDQFARQLGLFAKGQLGRLDYRLAINKPFALAPDGSPAGYRSGAADVAFAGYVQYMLADIESNLLPYTPGTYLGSKRVFNLGLGVHYQPNAMGQVLEDDSIEEHDMLLFGADVFFDQPISGGALTAYGAYYYYDFGPDYVRNVGIMAIGSGESSTANGPGNRYPVLGTGHHVYAQAGWLLPGQLGSTRLQPYAALQLSFMDGLADAAVTPEVGLNWLLAGHNCKITLHYRNRPLFVAPEDGGAPEADSRASELIGQLQVML